MCFVVFGKVIEVNGFVVVVDFGGVKREVRFDLMLDIKLGDWVIVYMGFVIEKLDEKKVMEIFEVWVEVEKVMEGF